MIYMIYTSGGNSMHGLVCTRLLATPPCGIALYQPASSVLCIEHGSVMTCLSVVQVGFGVFICASRLGH
jgi:hypothetical protein